MTDSELIHHLDYASKMADYFLQVGGRNRLLASRRIIAANGEVGAPDPNRVSVSVGLDLSTTPVTVGASSIVFGFKDGPGGNVLFQTTIFAKVADVAAVTPSPWEYMPYQADVTQLGPAIQGQPFFVISGFAVTLITFLDVRCIAPSVPPRRLAL